jgi:hypothetical protein
VYKPFLSGNYRQKHAGLSIFAGDENIASLMKTISVYQVSKIYGCKQTLYENASPCLSKILQSSIIFTAATRYPLAEEQSYKIKYYDLIYSFNLSSWPMVSSKGGTLTISGYRN